jgi:hypothetical protein
MIINIVKIEQRNDERACWMDDIINNTKHILKKGQMNLKSSPSIADSD